MNLLHTVEFYWPSRGGAQEVVRQISERMVKRGHTVTVATSALPERHSTMFNGVQIVEFDVSGNAVRGMHGEVQHYQNFLRQGQFDLMMNYAAQQWTADLAFPLLDDLPYNSILIPCGFSGLPFPSYQRYFAALPQVLAKYDALIFHASDYRDIRFAKQHGCRHLYVIPNGASADEFEAASCSFRRDYGIPTDEPMLLTVGSHTGAKGHAETIAAFRRARIGTATLVIIGNVIPGASCQRRCSRSAWRTRVVSFGHKRVLLVDPPREQVVAAYKEADLLVFLSNIEYSPLVLFEACAAGLPFLTSSAGNAAEIVSWTKGGFVLPSQERNDGWIKVKTEDAVRSIEMLWNDPVQRHSLGASGQSNWKSNFTWEKLVDLYEQLYQDVIRGRKS